jgi:hypothetical protein
MKNSCFYDNQFFGGGVVLLKDSILTPDGIATGMYNNFVSPDSGSNVDCPFTYQESIGSCINPDAKECPLVTMATTTEVLSSPNKTNKIGTDKSTMKSVATTISPTLFATWIMLIIGCALSFC